MTDSTDLQTLLTLLGLATLRAAVKSVRSVGPVLSVEPGFCSERGEEGVEAVGGGGFAEGFQELFVEEVGVEIFVGISYGERSQFFGLKIAYGHSDERGHEQYDRKGREADDF